MRLSLKHTAHYGAIQSFYWLTNMPLVAFGPMYLYALGLSNFSVGIFLAAASLLSILVQPTLGSLVDREIITLRRAIFLHVMALFTFGLLLILPIGPWKIVAHFLMLLSIISLQPFINTLSIDAYHSGIPIDFGIARGSASLMYGMVSLLLGRAVNLFGASIIPMAALGQLTLFTLIFSFFPKTHTAEKSTETTSVTEASFNRPFFLMLLGTFFLFVNHGALNNFLLRIVENVGGGAKELGIALGISAAVELPMMAGFTRLKRRHGTLLLLRVSSVFYVIKAILLQLSGTPSLLYLNQSLQALTFGLYFPTAVAFVQEILPYSLRARSQAMLVSTISLGGVVASLLGGVLLDLFGVQTLLTASTLFSLLGFVTLSFLKKKKEPSGS